MRDRDLRQWKALVRDRAEREWRELSIEVVEELACHVADVHAAAIGAGASGAARCSFAALDAELHGLS